MAASPVIFACANPDQTPTYLTCNDNKWYWINLRSCNSCY
jgi:hypothetical protein